MVDQGAGWQVGVCLGARGEQGEFFSTSDFDDTIHPMDPGHHTHAIGLAHTMVRLSSALPTCPKMPHHWQQYRSLADGSIGAPPGTQDWRLSRAMVRPYHFCNTSAVAASAGPALVTIGLGPKSAFCILKGCLAGIDGVGDETGSSWEDRSVDQYIVGPLLL